MALSRASLVALLTLFACALVAGPSEANTFAVNDTADQGDTSAGDAVCDSNPDQPGPQCTLRAAVQETNALNDIAPSHTINVPAGTYALSNGALAVTYNLNVVGAGARTTVIERSGQAAAARIFEFNNFTHNLSGVTVRNGIANASNNFFGGNVRADNASLTISDSTITGGSGSSGGGISNVFGVLTVRNSTVNANAADTGGGDGGAIQNFGNSDNMASLTVESSTISGNSARLGGGIISGGNLGNSVTVRNSTITLNNSGDRGGGGGLLVGTGTASFGNTIIAGNGSGAANPATPDCSTDPGASIGTVGFNLSTTTGCGLIGSGDQQSTSPKIGPLQNAGGPTDTHPLLAGSPAINTGSTAACPATDQRGIVRPQGPACDIGAFELVAPATAPDTVILSSPSPVTTDRTPTFTFRSSQAGTAFECSLDGGPFVACASPFAITTALRPGAHTFRVRAKDAAGSADPTPAEFAFAIPAELADLSAPAIGKTVNAEPVSGSVFVAVRAGSAAARKGGARAAQKGLKFIPLREAKQIPVGSFFDTRRGRVRLQTATSRRGRRQSGVFSGGLFQTLQSGKKSAKGVFEVRLKGSSFKNCKAKGRKASISRRTKRKIRRLSGNAKGRFRTRGRYSAATVRGTVWTVTDRCDGSLTKVSSGRVTVRDFRKKKNVRLRRGKSYLARAPG